MKFKINWKAGILSGVGVVMAGMVFFFLVGNDQHFTCINSTNPNRTPNTANCRVYRAVDRVITAYSDIWRSIFAPRCVGGVDVPDDCLGPDGFISMTTLFVIGFVAGNIIWRKKIETGRSWVAKQ